MFPHVICTCHMQCLLAHARCHVGQACHRPCYRRLVAVHQRARGRDEDHDALLSHAHACTHGPHPPARPTTPGPAAASRRGAAGRCLQAPQPGHSGTGSGRWWQPRPRGRPAPEPPPASGTSKQAASRWLLREPPRDKGRTAHERASLSKQNLPGATRRPPRAANCLVARRSKPQQVRLWASRCPLTPARAPARVDFH